MYQFGVTNAMCDGIPLIILCGLAATTMPVDAFQSCPVMDIMRPCTKWSYQIKSAAEVLFAMDYAIWVVRRGQGHSSSICPKTCIFRSLVKKSLKSSWWFGDPICWGMTIEIWTSLMVLCVFYPNDMMTIHLGISKHGLSFQVDSRGSRRQGPMAMMPTILVIMPPIAFIQE